MVPRFPHSTSADSCLSPQEAQSELSVLDVEIKDLCVDAFDVIAAKQCLAMLSNHLEAVHLKCGMKCSFKEVSVLGSLHS